MELVLLGTGSPMPNPDRCGAGQVIIGDGKRILVDCGWGVARRLYGAGVLPGMVDALCITHLHSDHITDIPDLLIMRWVGGATAPLAVYGPNGTQAMMDSFLAALSEDIRFRFAHHGEKLSQHGITCEVTELPATLEARSCATIGGVSIESFEVDHFPVVPALGFRLRHEGHTLIISGDTKKCPSLIEASRGADVLVCEAMNIDLMRGVIGRVQPLAAALLTDAIEYHTGTIGVAEMARDAGVGKLVLSHIIPPVPPGDANALAAFTAGMSDIYAGPIEVGRDLLRMVI